MIEFKRSRKADGDVWIMKGRVKFGIISFVRTWNTIKLMTPELLSGNDHIAIGHKLNELNGVSDGST